MGQKGTILVVDDDPESSQKLVDLLTTAGYEVRWTDNAALALGSTLASPPGVILIGHLSSQHGSSQVDLCAQLQSDARTQHISIITAGESGRVQDHIEALRAGAADFIHTPFEPDELLARVETHLELSRLRHKLGEEVRARNLQLTLANEQLARELEEHKNSVAALRESETRFQNLADNAPVMIVASGSDQLATYFNRQWLEFRGRTLEQEVGMGWTEGLHPDDRATSLANFSASFHARTNCHLEYRLRRADGVYRWVLCSGVPRYRPDGLFVGYIGSAVDVTDFKRGQEEQLALKKAESLAVLASGIVHDFNNLLGSIFAEADLALSELGPAEPAREHIENINNVATRASEIVDLLTAYAASGKTPRFEPVDLSALVQEMLRLMHVLLSRPGLKLVSKLDPAIPRVWANPAQLRRIVMNLLTNAVEALEGSEGTITIDTSLAQLPANSLQPSDTVEGESVSLRVADTGPGMSEEARAKALDPFFTTKFPGRGMGLAVVHSIVQSHGGAIQIDTSPGQGCAISVLLPCGVAKAARAASDLEASITPPARPRNVLLVEDEQALRTAVSQALEKRGLRVVTASDGPDALDKLGTQEVDLVLLDITLPGKSGLEVLVEMWRIRPNLPVVLTSAHELDYSSSAIREGNARPKFIRKPYRLSELLKLLREELDSNSAVISRGHTSN